MCASNFLMATSRGVCMALIMLAAGGAVHAEADREQEQLKRLRLQMRQLQQDQASLQESQAKSDREKQQAESSLKDTRSQLDSQRAAATTASRKLAALSTELAALKDERTRLSEQVERLTKELAESTSAAQRNSTRFKQLEGDLSARSQSLAAGLDSCRSHNADLYRIGTELLTRYENKGLLDVVSGADPFLQLARVRLENVKAEYQDKLDAARLKASSEQAAASKP
ncbi:MAG: hypothetical protein HY836_04705 [Aquabacterium sp.]|uniref:hypothetical protein n=1 Tax=Aquabacterium sp. TaxID=1872578 RepID=UPI0025BC34A2|nr:hypothetical protein [Aquabacterium sp.]MBI5924878.1 hypothetical protein [Aquabacterium sp.]